MRGTPTGAWATETATGMVAHAHTTAAVAAAAQTARDALAEQIGREGATWRDRCYAEIGAGTAAFAAKAGVSIRVSVTERNALAVAAGENGFLLVIPDFGAPDDRRGAGFMVRTRAQHRESDLPYDFDRDTDGALVLVIDGEPCGPERAARRLVDPWLRTFTIPGR